MKTLLFAALLLGANLTHAQELFPGLKVVLTEAEWKRAGLDRLTPDEIGVINAALIRHQATVTAPPRAGPPAVAAPSPTAGAPKPGLLARFGLGSAGDDWRSQPTLAATVVKWESANSFRLENGQIWEGADPITYELIGKRIEIQPRAHGQFALIVEGADTTLRVSRRR